MLVYFKRPGNHPTPCTPKQRGTNEQAVSQLGSREMGTPHAEEWDTSLHAEEFNMSCTCTGKASTSHTGETDMSQT